MQLQSEEHYLAMVLDLRTGQIVSWRLGTRHSSELTLAAVLDVLSKHPSPAIILSMLSFLSGFFEDHAFV